MNHKNDDIWEGLAPLTVDEIQSIDLSFNNMNSTLEGLEPITITLSDSIGNLTYHHNSNTYQTSSGTSIYTSPVLAGGGGGSGISISPSTMPSSVWANTYTNNPTMSTNNGVTTMSQDVEIKGNLKVNGTDIGGLLARIEEKLAIYRPEPELEEKWEELRELSKRYKELVADIREKEKIWDILKK
jgi:hypothetical protein